ncbi:long-chain-alcohol oxidase FAO1-like [Triticum aestivum]|uniref:long-chain-alcohol oxidase FAO1-like n=1 Tax=Triticum aestivum TaxID=4565 RepID=UPI001D01DD5F|nr:long-chain-alcohol oxidase FAO1-like [Triticum aestivum]
MEEDKKQRRRQGHPLLWGGGARTEPYTHGFSNTQMMALTAVCGTLVPSLPPDGHYLADDKAVWDSSLASAAYPPVPDEVAQLMSAMCLREALTLVRMVLWLLGTRLGMPALGGARCLSWSSQFVQRFTEMSVDRREDALRWWSRETMLPPLRLFFLLVKVFCLYVFYSWFRDQTCPKV